MTLLHRFLSYASNKRPLTQVDGTLSAVLVSAKLAQAGEWRSAYHLALANALIFLLLALTMFVLEPKSLTLILSAPAIFFLGAMLSFLLMARSGGDLAATTWFVLGSGVYFGMGVIAGGLHVHPHADYLFADDSSYLLRVNLLNASSVFIVLATSYSIANMRGLKVSQHDMTSGDIERNLYKILPYILVIATIGVMLKYFFFPVAESLLIRSITSKLYLLTPSCFLLLGILWRSSAWQIKMAFGSLLLLEMLNGLIVLTKYQVLITLLAFVVGFVIVRRSITSVLMGFMIVIWVLVTINPLITLGRAHIDYHAMKNTVSDRLEILTDSFSAFYLDKIIKADSESLRKFGSTNNENMVFSHNVKGMKAYEERLRALGRRFDVASIQGYLINEYNNQRHGRSLVDFWAVVIPRAIWPEKPIMTRFGKELHDQFFYIPGYVQPSSSVAPTYSAEAYWNFGLSGVVFVSILLGLAIGWLTRCWQISMLGGDPAFFLIVFPIAIWASSVESWIVGTFLGEFVILTTLYFTAVIMLKLHRKFNNRLCT